MMPIRLNRAGFGLLMGGLLAIFACPGIAKAAGEQIPFLDLPGPVANAMRTAIPGAKYAVAKSKQEFGMPVYEITGQAMDGRLVQLVLTKDGVTLAVNTGVTLKEVPRDVIDALNHWLKGYQTISVLRSVRNGGTTVWYEFVGTDRDGQAVSIHIRTDGKKVTIEQLKSTPGAARSACAPAGSLNP